MVNKIDTPTTTPTLRAIYLSVFEPFCRFVPVYDGHFVLCYKEKARAVIILRGHRSAWFPLLSACCFVEFDTSIICHVLVYCFGSFLLQDLFSFKSPSICF